MEKNDDFTQWGEELLNDPNLSINKDGNLDERVNWNDPQEVSRIRRYACDEMLTMVHRIVEQTQQHPAGGKRLRFIVVGALRDAADVLAHTDGLMAASMETAYSHEEIAHLFGYGSWADFLAYHPEVPDMTALREKILADEDAAEDLDYVVRIDDGGILYLRYDKEIQGFVMHLTPWWNVNPDGSDPTYDGGKDGSEE